MWENAWDKISSAKKLVEFNPQNTNWNEADKIQAGDIVVISHGHAKIIKRGSILIGEYVRGECYRP